jgi:hypothetical protein
MVVNAFGNIIILTNRLAEALKFLEKLHQLKNQKTRSIE